MLTPDAIARADRQVAGVVVGAVADVLEHVAALGERRLADPVRALAAHLGEAEVERSIHCDHEVAADAGIGARALRHHGRGIVRAAGAEIRRARRDVLRLGERACACFSRATRPAISSCGRVLRMRSPMQMAMSFGSSAPLTGNSQLPCSSFLPMHDRLVRRCRRAPRAPALRSASASPRPR